MTRTPTHTMTPLDAPEVEALVDMRRHLHKHPELSFEERQTQAYIEERLREVGITDITRCADTGVIAVIEGAHPGPTLAFRGDIDALPIIEDSKQPYASCNPGVMHACGHDVHATLGLGVARAMWRNRGAIHGRIKCIFQPAEEASPTGAPIGAERMAQEGALSDPDVDAIFAYHCMPTLDVGHIGYTGGPVWAGSTLVEITVRGQKTHAAYPHSGRGRDPGGGASHPWVADGGLAPPRRAPALRVEHRQARRWRVVQHHRGHGAAHGDPARAF